MIGIREDIRAARERDPAARGSLEIFLLYSALHAVWAHRVHHWLWRRGARFLARAGSQWMRSVTGVEIHPGATIGRRFFIDHGMGVVIGETAVVGDDCMIYHSVTLGGTGEAVGARHPRLGNRVVVGAGGKVLGAITLGDDTRVGANAVVLRDTPAGATLVGIPARQVPRNSIEYHI